MRWQTGDERQAHAYASADRDLRVRTLKLACTLGLFLMPLGISLDYYVYGGHDSFWALLGSRVVCDLGIAALMPLLWTDFGRRHIRLLGLAAGAIPVLSMCYMINVTEGFASPYYAGLNLAIIVVCLTMPFEVDEAIVYCVFVAFAYLVAGVAWRDPAADSADLVADLFGNLYFIVLTSTIGIFACYFNTRRRISDFELRYTLDKQNRQLTQLDRLKMRFFANVSHELRTPLTLILAPLEDLYRQRALLPEGFAQSLQLIRENGLRLLGLINDLLDIARLNEGKLHLHCREFCLDDVVAQIVDATRPLAERRHLRLTLTLSPERLTVLGDVARLEKVLLNLLSNAVKFTRSGGAIAVECRSEAGQARIEVADTGVGIPEDELPYVFERFHQVAGPDNRQEHGTGLGLALAKELTEAQRGRLTIASQVGKGTSVVLRLPLAEPKQMAALAAQTEDSATDDAEDSDVYGEMFQAARLQSVAVGGGVESATEASQAGVRVLVVDDETRMRHFLVQILSSEYRVAAAMDGESALQLADQDRPHLVLLDLMLPGIDGLEVCRRLRGPPHNADLKILMLTARTDEQVKIEALNSGADDFLTKPFSIVEVKTRIRNLLAAGALERDLRERNRELERALKELQMRELQLIQSEKMNALGSLAAGLLHEINNPLNYMRMAVTMAQRGAVGEDEKLAKHLRDIEAGIKRIEDIVGGLRDFAYPEQAANQQPFSIRESLQAALRFSRPSRSFVGWPGCGEPVPPCSGGCTRRNTPMTIPWFTNAQRTARSSWLR